MSFPPHYQSIQPSLSHQKAEERDQKADERDKYIDYLKRQLKKRNHHIDYLKWLLENRDVQLESLNSLLEERERLIYIQADNIAYIEELVFKYRSMLQKRRICDF